MKNLSFLILIFWIANASCQAPKNSKFSYIKITLIGNSDVIRDLIYISMVKMADIKNIDLKENVGDIDQIATDQKTLSNIISFLSQNRWQKSNSEKDVDEFGSFNITVYDKNTLIINYDLDAADSKECLTSLIDMLVENDLDKKVIKELKEDALAPIN